MAKKGKKETRRGLALQHLQDRSSVRLVVYELPIALPSLFIEDHGVRQTDGEDLEGHRAERSFDQQHGPLGTEDASSDPRVSFRSCQA